MRRFLSTVAAVWFVFVASVLGVWRVLLLVRMPFAVFEAAHLALLASVAIATVILAALQFLRPRSPKLAVVFAASLAASSGAVFLTYLIGRAILGVQLAYVIGPLGYIELVIFLLVCATETVWITAAVSRFFDRRGRSALTSAST